MYTLNEDEMRLVRAALDSMIYENEETLASGFADEPDHLREENRRGNELDSKLAALLREKTGTDGG